jgi:nitrous oxide reductase accessory protein NosL
MHSEKYMRSFAVARARRERRPARRVPARGLPKKSGWYPDNEKSEADATARACAGVAKKIKSAMGGRRASDWRSDFLARDLARDLGATSARWVEGAPRTGDGAAERSRR